MNNNNIKTKVKKAIGNQVIDYKHFCPICDKETMMKVKFKDDKATCNECKNQYPIDDKTYEIMYKELNKMGIF